MKKLLATVAFAAALAVSGGPAQADVFTFNPTFTDTGPAGNGLELYWLVLYHSVNVPLAGLFVDNFLTINSTNTNLFGTATDGLLVNFVFTVPGPGVGDPNIGGTGSETVFFGLLVNGLIDWTDNATVTFGNGSSLAIQLLDTPYNIHDHKVYVDADFVLVTPAQVPGPVVGGTVPARQWQWVCLASTTSAGGVRLRNLTMWIDR